jgi:hypothetical protein
MKPKFKTGREVMTAGVANWCDTKLDDGSLYHQVIDCLKRHVQGDWGDVCEDDAKANDDALKDGDRILSAYAINGTKIWIITEWDRSATTILFPDEY